MFVSSTFVYFVFLFVCLFDSFLFVGLFMCLFVFSTFACISVILFVSLCIRLYFLIVSFLSECLLVSLLVCLCVRLFFRGCYFLVFFLFVSKFVRICCCSICLFVKVSPILCLYLFVLYLSFCHLEIFFSFLFFFSVVVCRFIISLF